MFGLVHAHGVTKAVVMTTSRFTAAARRFAKGKPLELIDGTDLVSILSKAGIDVVGSVGPENASHVAYHCRPN
jgi:restriction system protein